MSHKALIILGVLLAICIKAFGVEQIHTRSLRDFDEARYAEVAQNIVRTGNWIIPLAGGPDEPRDTIYTTLPNGQHLYPYFWKPPLHPQIIAAFMHVMGVGELAVRLPTVLFALASCGFFYLLARRLFPDTLWAPLVAVLFFISGTDFSLLLGQGLAEMQLLCFCLAAVYCASYKTRTGAVLAGVAFGCAFLTKSFISFWVPAVVAFVLYERGQYKEFSIRLGLYLLAALVVAAPWHLLMYAQFGTVFIDRYFLTNSTGRTSGATGNIAPVQWYFIYMLDQWKPYVFILPALAAGIGASIQKRERSTWLLLLWGLVILIPLSIARSKVYWYIFPVWIPTALALAVFLERAYRRSRSYVLIAGIVAVFFSLHPYWRLSPQHIPLKQFALYLFVAGVVSFWLWHKKKQFKAGLFISAYLLILIVANMASIGGRMHQTDENRDLRALIQRHPHLPELTPIGYPYEAALYYSQIGNMQLYTPQARYIFAAAPLEDPTIRSQFIEIDREGRFTLYKKIR